MSGAHRADPGQRGDAFCFEDDCVTDEEIQLRKRPGAEHDVRDRESGSERKALNEGSERLDNDEDCEIAVHPFTDEDVKPLLVAPSNAYDGSTDIIDPEDVRPGGALGSTPVYAPQRPSLSTLGISCSSSSTNIKSAFTTVITTDVTESMFLDGGQSSHEEIEKARSAARKDPKALLGWKIELLEDAPFPDVRVVVAIKKVPFKHSVFCLFSFVGADSSQLPEIENRPPETEWCRLKREREGRPFRLIRKVAS